MNKKCQVSSDRSLEVNAIADILLFKNFNNDLILSDSGSSESEVEYA